MCCIFLQSSILELIENLNSANGFSIKTMGSFCWGYYKTLFIYSFICKCTYKDENGFAVQNMSHLWQVLKVRHKLKKMGLTQLFSHFKHSDLQWTEHWNPKTVPWSTWSTAGPNHQTNEGIYFQPIILAFWNF